MNMIKTLILVLVKGFFFFFLDRRFRWSLFRQDDSSYIMYYHSLENQTQAIGLATPST